MWTHVRAFGVVHIEVLVSPYRRPGWELPNGHVVRSQTEAALCEHLAAHAVPHEHGALMFEVQLARGRRATFAPDIVLTDARKEERAILVEAVASTRPGGGVRRLIAFLREFGPKYFLVVVAKRVLLHHIPEEAYDALVPLEDFAQLDALLAAPGRPEQE